MSDSRVLYQLARADFLERVRRYSFLLTLGFTLYLGYSAATGRIVLRLGDYRGVFNSAWTGALMALVSTCFLTLAGFYIVKNTIERDRVCGVGQILAATPLSKIQYCLGKVLSNFLVLAVMVALLIPAGLITQLMRGEDRHVDLWAFLSPFLLLALPAMAVVAALAVLFEAIRGLRGGLGNVLYFFLWASVPGIAIGTRRPEFDLWGLLQIWESAAAAARARFPDYGDSFSFSLGGGNSLPLATNAFQWNGVPWPAGFLLSRLLWFIAAVGLALLAASFFDRFDPAKGKRAPPESKRPPEAVPEARASAAGAAVHLTPLAAEPAKGGFSQVVSAELRLMLKGQKWWWYAVAAGLFVACLATPLAVARGRILPFAWIWPVLIWSAMGTREKSCQTNQLVFSAAHSLRRQLPALWIAGVLVAFLTGGGVAIRLLLASDGRGALGWLAGSLFIPTLALACGTWSGSSKLFEILYTLLWYTGPLQPTRQLDFMAASPASVAAGMPRVFFMVTIVLAGLALLARRRQLQS